MKTLGILLARLHCCWEPPKGAATEGSPLGTAVPLVPVLVPGLLEGSSSNVGRRAAPPWLVLMLAVSSACHLLWVRLSATLRWLFELWISAFFVLWPFAVQSSTFSFLGTHGAFILWVLDLPNSSASVMFHGKVFEGRLCSLASFYLFPFNSLKCYRLWVCLSIALLTYSERGNDLLDPCALDQPLLLSISLNFSLICLLACSAVPLCCLERGTYRHNLVSIHYFVSFGILCIFKYSFSFYRIKYFCFKSLLKHTFRCSPILGSAADQHKAVDQHWLLAPSDTS